MNKLITRNPHTRTDLWALPHRWADLLEPLHSWPEWNGDWNPQVDLKETPDAFLIRAELPGMKSEDVKVSVTPESISLAGEKTEDSSDDEQHCHIHERRYGMFQRTFQFHTPVDAEDVLAKMKDGVLTITLKKTQDAKPKFIKIKG